MSTAATNVDAKAGRCPNCRSDACDLCVSARCTCPAKRHPLRPVAKVVTFPSSSTQPGPKPAERSEMEMAADVLVALHRAGIGRIAVLTAAAGVPRHEWTAAVARHKDHGYRPPEGGSVVANGSAPARGGQHTKRYRDARPSPDTKRCPACAKTKPTSEFYVQNRRTGGLRNTCIPCSKEASTARYLRVGQVAVAVELLEGDGCIGHDCPRCGKPFLIGQRVVGDYLHHEACR